MLSIYFGKCVRVYVLGLNSFDLTCKRGSVGQSEGLSIPRSSVLFRPSLKHKN